MEFSILGPLEVRAGGRAIVLGGAKPRALMAVLLLHANEPVSAERLALALWGEDAPAGAVKNVQVYVWARPLTLPAASRSPFRSPPGCRHGPWGRSLCAVGPR
jgi:DNA-binding SARP family transcriptional activator